jgi:hypothetical protein
MQLDGAQIPVARYARSIRVAFVFPRLKAWASFFGVLRTPRTPP